MPAERRQDLAKDTLPAAPALQPLCIQPGSRRPSPTCPVRGQPQPHSAVPRNHSRDNTSVAPSLFLNRCPALPSAMRLNGEVVGLVFVHLYSAKLLNSEYNF